MATATDETVTAPLPGRTLGLLDLRSGRGHARLGWRADGAGGTCAEPPCGFVVVRPGKAGGVPLVLGILELTAGGWRYAPCHAGGVRARRGHDGPAAACKGRGPGRDDLVLTRREAVACRLLPAGGPGGAG